MAGPHPTGPGAAGRRPPAWHDESAGPVVRPYALTGGRTDHQRAEQFDMVALIVTDEAAAAGLTSGGDAAEQGPAGPGAPPEAAHWAPEPEHEMILALCHTPLSVVEIASELELPLGVVRVLLGDLLDRSLIQVRRPAPVAQFPSERVLKEVIDGIRAL
ncbi:DUF742 domain-containing protein [Actinomadura keratinilytica]|jgi:hypothetical protein|uniref:DUF742 domain-containing protein n=1 Tax=Actinomadura keratinilytica TaxID=547461 RepID=A0ABP7XXV3_9ACTN